MCIWIYCLALIETLTFLYSILRDLSKLIIKKISTISPTIVEVFILNQMRPSTLKVVSWRITANSKSKSVTSTCGKFVYSCIQLIPCVDHRGSRSPDRYENQYPVHVLCWLRSEVWISKRCASLTPDRMAEIGGWTRKKWWDWLFFLGKRPAAVCHWAGWTHCLYGWGLSQLKGASPGAWVRVTMK